MEKNKPLDKKEIEKEKLTLQREIERLDIYNNCYNYELDKLLCYFPNKATKIKKCFYKKEGKNVLPLNKQGQLEKIIMKELCSLFEPYIEKGFKVEQLDGNWCCLDNQKYLICLNIPDKKIGISIAPQSKLVFTNGEWRPEVNERKGNKNKLRLFPVSGIQQINCYGQNNIFHNEIKIFNYNMDYRLIIYPDTNTIKLTDFDEKNEYKTFCDQNNKIFKDKEDIIHFFSTLSFAEIEQVLQILNEHLEGEICDEVDIGPVLKKIKNTIEKKKKIKNTIEKNRPQKQENGEEIDNKNKNSDAQLQLEMEEDDKICCNECITCLKQCWSTILMK